MNQKASIRVGEFFVDSANQRLWKNGQPIDLVPQVWSVFRVLLERPDQTVAKRDLLAAAWPGVEVSDAALSQTIRRLRSALGDDARKPRYIETVHRRGFRLIAPLSLESPPESHLPTSVDGAPPFVGRVRECELLANLMTSVRGGTRQVAFIEGNAGIGKSALVDAFRAQCRNAGARVVAAQCVQQHGVVEPYMPVLEALDRSVRSAPSILPILRRYAPSWLLQMPWLLDPGETQGFERSSTDAPQTRMLREMALTLEVMSADRPFVLIIEDLHWADQSTIDLLSLLASRPDPAQLMIIGTYRPVEAITFDHPIPRVVRALAANGNCIRVSLDGLVVQDIRSYLGKRFHWEDPPERLAEAVHSRSEGNPLFMVAILDHLVGRGTLACDDGRWQLARPVDSEDLRDVPSSLREMISHQLASLGDRALEVLRAASVAAVEFRSASVASALGLDGPDGIQHVESVCDRLAAHGHMIKATGEQVWPDGTHTATYRFRHQLYRQSLYESLGANLRRRYHQSVGERLEAGFASDQRRVVPELASHFGQSGDHAKAVSYFGLAAHQAHQRFAHREEFELLHLALPHLEKMPPDRERDIVELQLRSGIVLALWLGELELPEEENLQTARIQELSSGLDCGDNSFGLSHRLWKLYSTRSRPDLADSFADRMLEAGDLASERQLGALTAKGTTAMMYGRFDDAIHNLRQALQLLGDGPRPGDLANPRSRSSWQSKALPIHGYIMVALALVGSFRRSLEHMYKALAISTDRVPPKYEAAAHLGAAGVLYYVLGNTQRSRTCSEQGLALAGEHNLSSLVALARLQLTCLDITCGEPCDLATSISEAWRGYLETRTAAPAPLAPILLANACRESGFVEEGLGIVDTVWRDTRESGLRWYDPELHRIKGDLLLDEGGPAARERALECYDRALTTARQQGCRFYELRAAISRGRLDHTDRKSRAALSRAYAAVEPEIATPDLIAAAELIDR